jgi:TRAP-type C4-dicarboxylate transport system permease small subunit
MQTETEENGPPPGLVRRSLDALYLAAGIVAGIFLLVIFVLMMALSLGRQIGFNIPAGDEFAAWSMAAMAFLGLAHTFRSGEMIRVGLLVDRLSGRARHYVEIVCLVVGLGFVGYFTWYAVKFTYYSWLTNDMAQGWRRCRCSSGWARSCSAPAWRSRCSPAWRPGSTACRAGCCTSTCWAAASSARCRARRRPPAPPSPRSRCRNSDAAATTRWSLGSLCGASTLGILIPPSIAMIVYAVAADVSIIRMFLAGILPGVMLLCLFSGYIIVWALLNPDKTRRRASLTMSLRQRIKASGQLIPVTVADRVRVPVHGLRVATANEASAFGVLGALCIACFGGSLSPASPSSTACRAAAHELHDHVHPGRGQFPDRGHGIHGHSDGAVEWVVSLEPRPMR